MKIAYLFSGHLRTFRDNTTLKTMLLDANSQDYSCFVHTYRTHNFTANKWHADDAGANELTTYEDTRWIRDNYPNTQPLWIDPKNAGYEYMPPGLANCGFRHTRQRVNEIMRGAFRYNKKLGPFDLACMIRFDIGLREPLVFSPPKPNTLYAAYNHNMVRQGLDSDTITWGTPEVIWEMNVPAVPQELSDSVDPNEWCGEKLCTAVRKLRGFDYQTQPVRHFFYRSGGGVLDVETGM